MNTTKFYQVQSIMFNHSEDDTFFVAKNSSSADNKMEYASFKSPTNFLELYQKLPNLNKSFYELIDPDWYMYEYYDLDIAKDHIENTALIDNSTVFNWFINIRNKFINSLQGSCNLNKLKNPHWIITTASSEKKISLHLLNKNTIFVNQKSIKVFTDLFQSFYKNYNLHNSPHIFNKSPIDFNVYSKNRLMRITDSSKPNQNRPLKFWKDFHKNDSVSIIDSLITNARHDKQLNNKLIYSTDFYITSQNFNITTENTEISKTLDDDTIEYIDPIIIENLLNILSPDRVDDYNLWLNISICLKNSGYDFELFDSWSQKSDKYNSISVLKTWNSINENYYGRKKTIGSIIHYAKHDNPNEFNKIMSLQNLQNTNNNKIIIPFTEDITIHEKYISQDLYINHIKNYDIICIKSNMNTGKTYSLPSLFNDYKRIIVVYSRISLNEAIYNKWKLHGFELYSNIKTSMIDTDIHQRIIVQIDSLHRVINTCDLLILDEIETTHEHLCGSRLLEKTSECFQTLMSYTKHTQKIIMSDANLKDETINHLLTQRTNKINTIKIKNTYQSFCNIKTRFYFDDKIFLDSIQSFAKNNKKIVIPTNSKKKAKIMEKIILDVRPDYKILRIDMENKCEDVSSWNNYDIVIYTPTITAGVSFDDKHFDMVCAWFTRKSTSAEQSSQMLFRARHINDNEMHILLPADIKEEIPSIPIDDEGLTHFVNSKIQLGNDFLKKDGLKIDNYNRKVKETKYFKFYISYLKKESLSFSYFQSYMRHILLNHGAKLSYEKRKIENEDEEKELKKKISKISVEITEQDAKNINDAVPITDEQYIEMSKKIDLTKDEIMSIKKYKLYKAFDKDVNSKLSQEWVEKNIKYIHSVIRYKEIKDIGFTYASEYIEEKKEQVYEEMIQNKILVDYSDDETLSSDSENEDDNKSKLFTKKLERKKRQKFIKHVGQTVVESINYDKTYHKIKHCVQFLLCAGFKNLESEKKCKPNFQSMIDYVRANEKDLRILWNCKRNSFEGNVIEDTTLKRGLMQYINSKLEGCLGVKIERFKNSGDCKEYVIKKQFVV